MKRRLHTALAVFALVIACLALPAGAIAAQGAAAGRAPLPGQLQQKGFSPPELLTNVLKNLISTAGKKALEKGLKGNEALGWVLAAFGLGDIVGGEDELAPIREKLDELSRQVSEVRSEIKDAKLEAKIGETNPITSVIDHVFKRLGRLAALPPNDATRQNLANKITAEIGENLLTAPEYFNKILGSHVPLGSNLLKSASGAVEASHRFFDRGNSAEVRDLYEYFAAYQTQLAVLLTEYFHTEPQTYAPQFIEAEVKDIEQNLASQEKSLKPPVPENAVIDTKTGLMWLTGGRQAEKRPAMIDYLGLEGEDKKNALWDRGDIRYTFAEQADHASPWDVPWGGRWKLPTLSEFETLISGRGDASPINYLVENGHFNRGYLDAADSKFWVNPRDWNRVPNFVYYKLFSFRTGEVARTDSVPFLPKKWREAFAKPKAIAIYNRRPDAGEEYWWK
jgi:hypothetical protein